MNNQKKLQPSLAPEMNSVQKIWLRIRFESKDLDSESALKPVRGQILESESAPSPKNIHVFLTIRRRAVVSRDTISLSLGLVDLKPRSRLGLGTSKSRKMGMSRSYFQSKRKNPQ